MDWNVILSGIGTTLALGAFLGRKFDKLESRIDGLEERIFFLATGKTLKEAVELQMKEKK